MTVVVSGRGLSYARAMERLIGVAEAARLLGIHPQTLRVWDVQGKVRIVRTPGGKRRVPESEIRRLQGGQVLVDQAAGGKERSSTWAIYARVSSHEQKARGDMARQVARLREGPEAQGVSHPAEVTDVASGLSDRRPGLLRLMAMARQGQVTDIAITSKDRLTRFCFGYLEEFFSSYGVTIHVVDGQEERESVQEELVDDLIASVTSFSGKLYGLRSHGRAKDLVDLVKRHVAGAGGTDSGGA